MRHKLIFIVVLLGYYQVVLKESNRVKTKEVLQMVTDVAVKEPELKLSCNDSRLLLKVIPLRRKAKDMAPEEIAAIKHYLYCRNCRDLGLAGIVPAKLSCQEALLVWAETAIALWLTCDPIIFFHSDNLIETYAVEHVCGKYGWHSHDNGSTGWDITTRCRQPACMSLYNYWRSVPMSTSAGDGPNGVIYLFPVLIKTFVREGWPLNQLLALQAKRVADVLRDFEHGKVTVSSNHYHSIGELTSEIEQHVKILQELALPKK